MRRRFKINRGSTSLIMLAALFLTAATSRPGPLLQADNPHPPDHVVKLIFIHHSTGGNWLADPSQNELGGDLGRALMDNNYFASATNYGWGPDSIGDATDIPNWVDWYRGPNSTTYLEALYNEDDQNFGDFGSWPRLSDDPGGENQVIMFKSCFPNSDLEGNPDDPPDPEGWLTVGHAKYVYNEILKYFATRPDKLFIVITAPPLRAEDTTPEHAANARAFNNWLVDGWLAENNYPSNNVAVFDFYNVLTGPDAHHWFNDGHIERITGSRDTLFYPSGDGHPSVDGNRKATQEFIPLLNIFYNRWAENAPAAPPAGNDNPPATSTPGEGASSGTSGLLADFETTGVSGWLSFRDETTPSQASCDSQNGTTHAGSGALQIDFDVPSGTWATCELPYDQAQDWSAGDGLSFYIRASRADLPYNLLVFSGSADDLATNIVYTQTPAGSNVDWVYVEFPWGEFRRAEWEADGGSPFETPGQVFTIGFGFDGLDSSNNTGTVWVDDIKLVGLETAPEVPPATDEGGGGSRGLPCLGSLILPLLFTSLAWLFRRK